MCFNQTTGDLIIGDKQRRGTINKFDQTNKIGSKNGLINGQNNKIKKIFHGYKLQ